MGMCCEKVMMIGWRNAWSMKLRGRPKRTWKEVVREDCQAFKLNKEDAVDRCKWRKVIKEVRWPGWVWAGECFFWNRPAWLLCCCLFYTLLSQVPSVLWRCWLGGRKGIRPVKTQWWGAGVAVCLEQGADLHMAQLMTLPLTISCFSKIQTGFTFLVPAHLGSPRKRAVKCVCVCV